MMGQQRSSPSYYSILGLGSNSSSEEIKRAYRKLAMQWHPDRWAKNPSLLCEAKSKFQQIQEAYSVLSDYRKRTLYDAGLYDPDEEEDEGFSDFMQEMLSLMAQERTEDKHYTMEELQGMLVDMAQEFQSSPWYCGSSIIDDGSRPRNSTFSSDSHSRFSISGWGMYGMSSFCS